MKVARVCSWTGLPHTPAAVRLGGGGTRLLMLAVALATGEPVDLRDGVRGLGRAHARRVVEVIAIATGYPEAANR